MLSLLYALEYTFAGMGLGGAFGARFALRVSWK